MSWKFYMTWEGLELLTDIPDLTSPFSVILRCESSEWLDLSIKSDLITRFAYLRSLEEEGLELLTNIRDFTTLFSLILRCKSSE